MFDNLFHNFGLEVNSVSYKAKCMMYSKKISDNRTLLQIFIKNNPDYKIMGDLKCQLYAFFTYFNDGHKVLVVTSSDSLGRDTINQILKNKATCSVLDVSTIPFKLSVDIAENHFLAFDDQEIDKLRSENGLTPLVRSLEDIQRKLKQADDYDRAFRRSLGNNY